MVEPLVKSDHRPVYGTVRRRQGRWEVWQRGFALTGWAPCSPEDLVAYKRRLAKDLMGSSRVDSLDSQLLKRAPEQVLTAALSVRHDTAALR
eukprot:9228821-Lingulodinium_polyedra.AAC.1